MKIALAANGAGAKLKDSIKDYLLGKGYEIEDLSHEDIFTATENVVNAILTKGITRGIVVDDYGVAPFMIAAKHHGIVCAPTYEDYTSSMTRHHNSTQIITLGANVTAEKLSCELAENFVKTEYDGGRHQIRIDMLNREV